MKRFVTILALALFVMAPAARAQQVYGWSISSSPTDPAVNSAPAPTFGVLNLYLWLVCATPDGAAAAEFQIASPAPGGVLAFTATNGFLNAGSPTEPLLATPCTNGPVSAGIILALDTAAGDYCLLPSTANAKLVTVDCTNFIEWSSTDTNGFNNSGGVAACTAAVQPLCSVISVEDSSWGAVKSLYR